MRKTFPPSGDYNPNPQIDVSYKVMASGSTLFPTLGVTSIDPAFSFYPTVPSIDQPGLQYAVPDVITFVDSVLAEFDRGVNSDNRLFPAGYLSLRVCGRTAALLGMQRFDRNGLVEVSLLG